MKRRRTKILSLLLMMAVSFTMLCGNTGAAFAADYDKTRAASNDAETISIGLSQILSSNRSAESG